MSEEIRKETFQVVKLMLTYSKKIDHCDEILESQRKSLIRLRKVEMQEHGDDKKTIKRSRKVIQARREAYIQSWHDLKSILDVI